MNHIFLIIFGLFLIVIALIMLFVREIREYINNKVTLLGGNIIIASVISLGVAIVIYGGYKIYEENRRYELLTSSKDSIFNLSEGAKKEMAEKGKDMSDKDKEVLSGKIETLKGMTWKPSEATQTK